VVSHVPPPEEVAELTRLSGGFASRLAVLIHLWDPGERSLPAGRDDDRAAQAARTSLARAGWEVLLLRPSGRLRELWDLREKRAPRGIAVSS
jgi:hypothetical protein